jgi:integrase
VPLTNLQIRTAAARDRDYKLSDGLGLYLLVSATGCKSWRLKYRHSGKERSLSFGRYPDVTLAQAREERDQARAQLSQSRDPVIEKKKQRMVTLAARDATFQRVALDWHDLQRARWSPLQSRKVEQALRRDVFPDLGRLPLAEIDARMVLLMLRKVEARGAIDTAKRIRQHVSAVFCFGIAESIVKADPTIGLTRALRPVEKKGRQPAVRSLEAAKGLLRAMDTTTAGPLAKLASRLLAMTVVRPGVVRAARWAEFEGIDWTKPGAPAPDALWRIPAHRMKLDMQNKDDESFEHVVPLPPQVVEVLHAIRRLTARIEYLFPSCRSIHQPMSENTISYMYARNGYSGRHVPHGWRATFSTVMNERAALERRYEDRAIIDAMLAHRPKGMSGSEMAYNRALYMTRRREIAQEWASMIASDLKPANDLLCGQTR